jgi:hypothetical protein
MRFTRTAMDRRTLLRGAGVALGLPLLEAMIPSAAQAAATATSAKRLQVFYLPNGMVMQDLVPKQIGAGYEMSPILKPLEAYRDRFSVISGLAHDEGNAKGDGPGDHARACSSYLTGTHPKKSDSSIHAGVSMDQLVAQHIGRDTTLPSLELGIEPSSTLGSCDSGYSCAYSNTMSWRTATTPLPVSIDPRTVFERVFGDGDSVDKASRLAQLRRRASLLDFVMEDAARMNKSIGVHDRQKMEEYFDAVREVEKRIQTAEKNSGDLQLPDFARPSGIPDAFEDHVRLMIDMQVLAMQANVTRVSTFMIGREGSQRSYPQIGVSDAHHSLSHHGNEAEKLAKLSKINTLHMEMFAYQMKRLSEAKEGEGSLLDNTLILAGASLADPNTHDHMDLTAIVAGGLVKGGRHIVADKHTPFANLMVSVMDKLDLPETAIGDSTGPFKALDA